jgi:hypothetical protein
MGSNTLNRGALLMVAMVVALALCHKGKHAKYYLSNLT